MQDKKNLSEKESFDIIHQMIGNARNNITDNGMGWLLWGSMIFVASISTYIFIETGYRNIFLGWNIFGIISILLLVYAVIKPRRKGLIKTYVDDLLRLFDIGFAVCLFLIILSINISQNYNEEFGYFLMIYGFLMLIQGGALKFRPLIIGAVANWIGAAGVFINKEFRYDMLITAAAVFIGYIIPGYMLRKKYNRMKKDIPTL
ncbi:MAG: hypothetical protein ABJA78_16175 [Ferruginibacter sp.]